MCGIVGLFLKDPKLQPQPGTLLTDMLITMTDRGPDSAGIAIYSDTAPCRVKITAQSTDPAADFAHLDTDLQAVLGQPVTLRLMDSHAVLELPLTHLAAARAASSATRRRAAGMSTASAIPPSTTMISPKTMGTATARNAPRVIIGRTAVC